MRFAPLHACAALAALPLSVWQPSQDPSRGCDLVAAIAEGVGGMEITRGRAKVGDYVTGDTTYGCEVRLRGAGTLFGDLAAPTDYFKQRLERAGWTEDLRYAADGPSGTGFVLRRGSEMCLFQGGWEGAFWMVARCTVRSEE